MMTIRQRLLLLLLPALVILMLLGGLADYWIAVATTRNAYDQALASVAVAAAASLRSDDGKLQIGAAQRAGFPETASGHFTTGGAEANYTALICALTRACPGFALDGARANGAAADATRLSLFSRPRRSRRAPWRSPLWSRAARKPPCEPASARSAKPDPAGLRSLRAHRHSRRRELRSR